MDNEILEQFQMLLQAIESVQTQVQDVKAEVQGVKSEIKETETRIMAHIENEVGRRIDSLFDGYKLTHEKQWELERQNELLNQKLEGLLSRVEALENKIA